MTRRPQEQSPKGPRQSGRFRVATTAVAAAAAIFCMASSTSLASAQPVPATEWSFNVSDAGGPLNWGFILNTDGDVLYPSCFMDEFPAPRRFHDVHLKTVLGGKDVPLSDIRLDYLVSNHFQIELKDQGKARPSLTVSLLDIQCSARHPHTGNSMALQRIEFLIPAENEMGYVNGLEVHLVHQQLDGNNVPLPTSVAPEFTIATFYDGSVHGGTPEISKILSRAPQTDGAVEVTDISLDAELLFPAKRDYLYFSGVVPKPPCDVQADYALLVQNMMFSQAQKQHLRRLLFGTNLSYDENQRNSALINLRNKAALAVKHATYQYYVTLQNHFPLRLPDRFEPFSVETKMAIVGFIFGALAGLTGLVALVFAICRPRTRIGKKETEIAMAQAAANGRNAAADAAAAGNNNPDPSPNGSVTEGR